MAKKPRTPNSPRRTALLIILNAKLYELEKEREITRYRFSVGTLREISKRALLRQSFLSDLEDALAELGWLFIPLGTEYAVMSLARTETWVKLAWKRLSENKYFDLDDDELEETYAEHFPLEDGDSNDD